MKKTNVVTTKKVTKKDNKTTSKKVSKPTYEKISRSEMTKKIMNSDGKWMQIHCNTKDGAANVLNCVKPKGGKTDLGYILVTERGQGTKTVDPRTLRELKVDKKHYKVGK